MSPPVGCGWPEQEASTRVLLLLPNPTPCSNFPFFTHPQSNRHQGRTGQACGRRAPNWSYRCLCLNLPSALRIPLPKPFPSVPHRNLRTHTPGRSWWKGSPSLPPQGPTSARFWRSPLSTPHAPMAIVPRWCPTGFCSLITCTGWMPPPPLQPHRFHRPPGPL